MIERLDKRICLPRGNVGSEVKRIGVNTRRRAFNLSSERVAVWGTELVAGAEVVVANEGRCAKDGFGAEATRLGKPLPMSLQSGVINFGVCVSQPIRQLKKNNNTTHTLTDARMEVFFIIISK